MALQQQSCPAGVDDSFGPWAGLECRGGFDFTILFEESILAIPLQCLFMIALPAQIFRLARSDCKVGASVLRPLKAVASICLVALNAALVALWGSSADSARTLVSTRATVATSVLVFIASLGLAFLSWLEHDRSIRPGVLLSSYLFLSILLDIPRVRTLWMMTPGSAIVAVFTCTLAIRASMLVLESCEKQNILLDSYKGRSKESTSSPASRTVFFWLTSLFWKGYRKILTLQDLYPLDEDLESQRLHRKFADAWEKVPNKTAPGVLFSTWLRAFSGPVMIAVIPKIFLIAFLYAQPFLINAAIILAGLPQMQPFNNAGYGLIGAYVIVYTGIAVSTGQYEWRIYRAATMMRGSIIALVYDKALRQDLISRDVSPRETLTLIGTDSETIIQGLVHLHEIWGAIVEIVIGIYLLSRELGAACAMPIALAFVSIIVTGILAVPTGKATSEWIKASENRVTTTSKTLGGIKWLKISGLSDFAFSVIQRLRQRELEISKRFRILFGVTMMFLICTPIWTPVLTFATYAGTQARGDNTLTIAKAFTSITLFTLINRPLSEITIAIPLLAMGMASSQRIQDFLNRKEHSDLRQTEWSEKSSGSSRKGEKQPISRALNVPLGEESHELDTIQEVTDASTSLGQTFIASIEGSFSWKEEAEPILDIPGWKIRRRVLSIVLGPVGCGKSTLLRALLGELSSFKGIIRTNYSGVTYCGQSPWIPNDTVRNVIVGSAELDDEWYHAVIKACDLEHDIQNWPSGDNTVAGSRGISMSGGQKHRLAIARAVYSRKEFVIFDDVFTGLDASTEDIVFDNLFGEEGLLRNSDITVVIASSDARRAIYAGEVLILTENGRIKTAGTPEELSSILGNRVPMESKRRADLAAKDSDNVAANSQGIETVVATMEAQADATRQLGDPKMYIFYAKAAGWFTLASFLISMVLFAFLESFPSIWLKWWAEANEISPNEDLGKWLGVYAALGVGAVITILFGIWQLFIVVINNSGVYFHDVLLKTTSRAPLSFHAAIDPGVTVNRFSQDLQLIDMELPGAALGVAVSLSFAVAQLALVAASSKYMAIFLPFIIITFYGIAHFYLRTSRQMRLLDIEFKAPLYTQLVETLEGIETIRSFQWQRDFERKNMHLLDDSQRPSYLLYCLQRWLTFTVDMMVTVLALVLIVFTTTLREQIGPGYMGIALSNILGFGVTLKGVITSWVQLETSLGAVARVRSFASDTNQEGADQELSAPGELIWPEKGAVEFQEVTASYQSSGTVLREVTFSIQPGQKVAICGRTGSGKSSLALCLLRMIELDKGSIKIDGVDIATLPHEYLRSRITAVPQETYIFDGSVRLNVDPSETISDEEIIRALEKVQLWSKIQQRGGLDAVIDDKFFSSGEAQLLVFARAMIRESKVLILDEINSSLDNETNAIIQDVLRTWFQDWTVIAIIHKLDSILDFDCVAVLNRGQLVEYGETRHLLQQDSAIRKLHEAMPHEIK